MFTTITLLSFLAKAVLRCAVNNLTLDNLLCEASLHLHFPRVPEPQTYRRKVSGEAREDRERISVMPSWDLFPHHLLSYSPPSVRCRKGKGSTSVWGVSPLCLSHGYGRELLHQYFSCSYSLMLLNFSTFSLSSVVLSRSSSCLQLM